ncbi:uncharacterized membrane protein YjjB (DUF3815 family) [Clostridium punense]|uniref:Uncharacterized membrane protein YjjB (DUF3815 family) n=2 Tax=root TaxID=1 RepID=A0ABS4KA74_9CLOT|nr:MULTISPECIES: threonine/serine exporter family protein [Clostridium]EQB89606.1 hypothetical protein M918_19880 [Clostridium sp. BL8]MBP2024255.1 uncharacterized membrane protein YjjB (DUF3815 family) [Clostridium punense]
MIYITQIATAFIGSLGFSILFNIKGRRLWLAAIGGMLSWIIYLLLGNWIASEMSRYFISTMVVTIYSEVLARIEKTPTTTFLTSSVVPLIPGRALYFTMNYAVNGMMDEFLSNGSHTVGYAAAIAAGIMAGSSLFRISRAVEQKLKNLPLD